jgi:Bacterial self-protective colicin-like immunity
VTEPPDLRSYVALIDQFVVSDVTAEQFDLAYLRLFLGDHRMFGDPWYPVLNDLFYACEAYVIQPELRTEPGNLDEAQLLEAARTARARLAALGV